jgi:regulator of CtrA degradation
MSESSAPAVTNKIINALYIEAMVLADEARAYFDLHSRESRNQMTPLQRVGFSCESLKVTTRLMHVIAWLLNQRARAENAPTVDGGASQRLGDVTPTDQESIAQLPEEAQQLILASAELYRRVKRLEDRIVTDEAKISPARSLQSRLLEAF